MRNTHRKQRAARGPAWLSSKGKPTKWPYGPSRENNPRPRVKPNLNQWLEKNMKPDESCPSICAALTAKHRAIAKQRETNKYALAIDGPLPTAEPEKERATYSDKPGLIKSAAGYMRTIMRRRMS